jgi:hypothetical protein
MAETIGRGQQGKEVEYLQRLLGRAGQRIVSDGVYGPRTQAAVAAFLRSHGLAGTGASVDAELLHQLERATKSKVSHTAGGQLEPATQSRASHAAGGPPDLAATLARGRTDLVATLAAAGQRGGPATASSVMPRFVAESRDGIDCLGVQAEARAFARLLCSRRTGTPLSIGLFGDWGSGKSFFMSKLQGEIEARCAAFTRVCTKLQAQADAAGLLAMQERWHGRVAQITFNAWHFAEPNLWASLVTRVFDELASIVNPAESLESTRARLLAQVSDGKQRREQAKLELRTAEEQLALARAERDRREAELTRVREELAVVKAVVPIQSAPKGEGSDAEVVQLSVGGPIAALRVTLRWVWSRGRWTRVALIAGMVLLVLGVVLAIATWRKWLDLSPQIAVVTSVAGVGAGVISTISAWWAIIQPRIEQTRAAHAVYMTQRATAGGLVGRALQDLLSPGEGALSVAHQRMEEAEVGLDSVNMAIEQASKQVAEARESLQELEGGQRFYAFVRDRDAGDDYRRHLGLLSMVRDDFSRLEQILDQVEREGPDDGELASLSRIVLYIDDLDRCEPERVVEVLQALSLLMTTPIFVVVVAADIRWLRRSLALHYDRLLHTHHPSTVEPDADATHPTPRGYLEKIFHIPFSLRPIDADGFAALVSQVVQPGPAPTMRAATRAEVARIEAVAKAEEDEATGTAKAAATAAVPAITEAIAAAAVPATTEATVATVATATAVAVKPDAEPETTEDAEALRVQAEQEADLSQDVALTLDATEIAFLQRSAAVVGSPRLAKALVNTYRLLRTEIEAEVLPSYVADGTCRGVLTLLAIQVGRPSDATLLFDALHRTQRVTLGELLRELGEETHSDRREARWHALAGAVAGAGTADVRVADLMPWTDRIRRFSFDPWPDL